MLARVLLIQIAAGLLVRAGRFFQVSAAKNVCARSGWPFCKSARAGSTCSNMKVSVMKDVIRIVKRGSEVNKDDVEAAVPAKPRLTTEMIVKRWIIDSRERRQADISQLQTSIGWKGLGGVARG